MECVFLIRHLKYSGMLSKIHSYRLFFKFSASIFRKLLKGVAYNGKLGYYYYYAEFYAAYDNWGLSWSGKLSNRLIIRQKSMSS